MKRRFELNEVDFVRMVWVFGIALGTLSSREAMPIGKEQVADLFARLERESVLVPDDND